MSKHTAGPWFVEDNPTIFPAVQVAGFEDSGNRHLQVVIYSNSQEEDARLIAAAPDLLEALMMARDALATALRTAAPDWFETKEDIAAHVGIKQIDTAIAKATGEAQ